LDDFSTGRVENLRDVADDVQVIKGDIRDIETVAGALRGAKLLFHLAANASVARSVEDPLLIHELNASGTLGCLLAAKKAGVNRVVYASSTAVYGNAGKLPISEGARTQPLSPYGASKLAGENYCSAFTAALGLPTISLRYFNVFGPRQDPSSPYAAVIPRFISALIAHKPPTVFGDGEQTRDFIFVDDVVRANMLAAVAPDEALGQVFNIAAGVAHSIAELAHLLRGLLGGPEPVYEEAIPGDIKHSLADVTEAERVLRFRASVPIEEGLRRTVDWFLSRERRIP